ncbi:MAG: hypothetical protein IPH88_09640 [Bacteroidales bacterium]|nr:hypothetical protein [Bacteroidales bacterium]
MPRKRKRVKKIKYYKAEFKIPESTKKRLKEFCSKHKTTPNKVFRKALREYLDRNLVYHDHADHMVAANQMSIFDLLEEGSS